MLFLRHVIPVAVVLAGMTAFSYRQAQNTFVAASTTKEENAVRVFDFGAKATEARRYASRNGFNESVVFLIDMSVPSSRNRFFIYDLKNDSVLATALVSHGICHSGEPGARFSNTVGSGCSSLGKYKIGKSYYGQWGYSYKLHGLETSNNNAYERTVVLHSHAGIPDFETGSELVQSLGCPMVSPTFLQSLKKIINGSSKPVMLWIYN
jgi:hypothetical protein